MKLLHIAVLLSGSRGGRPNSHGVLFATDMTDDGAHSAETKSCYTQNSQIDADWRTDCIVADECCSKKIVRTVSRTTDHKDAAEWHWVCDCIHYKEAHNNRADECCAKGKEDGTCGCMSPDTGPQASKMWRSLPLVEEDCCHKSTPVLDRGSTARQGKRRKGYNPAEMFKCGPRPCRKPGSTLGADEVCCEALETTPAGNSNRRHPTHVKKEGDQCDCIHNQQAVDDRLQEVQARHCCSGAFTEPVDTPGIHVCGCIAPGVEFKKIHASAEKTDCCSGRSITEDGVTVCQVHTCALPHETPKKAEACCADQAETKGGEEAHELNKYKDSITKSSGKICGCIKGGVTVPNEDAAHCCSRRAWNGKCAWISYDVPIKPSYMTADECFSGHLQGKTKKCACMRFKADTRGDLDYDEHPGECCGGAVVDMGKGPRCGCIHAPNEIRIGADATDCCSQVSDPGSNTCKCGILGSPFLVDTNAKDKVDCCSGKQSGGFCTCAPYPEATDAKYCCGKKHDGHNCVCLKDGHLTTGDTEAERNSKCCSHTSSLIAAHDHDGHDHCEKYKCGQ